MKIFVDFMPAPPPQISVKIFNGWLGEGSPLNWANFGSLCVRVCVCRMGISFGAMLKVQIFI